MPAVVCTYLFVVVLGGEVVGHCGNEAAHGERSVAEQPLQSAPVSLEVAPGQEATLWV